MGALHNKFENHVPEANIINDRHHCTKSLDGETFGGGWAQCTEATRQLCVPLDTQSAQSSVCQA